MTRYDRLARALDRNRAEVLRDASQSLARAHLPHYEEDGPAEALRRLELLFDVVEQSLDQRSARPMVQYAEGVARQRLTVGYDLGEVQGAFNAFEEAVWHHLLLDCKPRQFVDGIGVVSALLGAAKDALANAYVAAAKREPSRPRKAEELFKGTVGT